MMTTFFIFLFVVFTTVNPLSSPCPITVLGGGNFALALSTVCAANGHPTTILVRDVRTAESINQHNIHPHYMSDLSLPESVVATIDPKTAFENPSYIIHAVPVQYSRGALEKVVQFMDPDTPILSASKGIETTSLGFMADILKEVRGSSGAWNAIVIIVIFSLTK